MPKKVLFVEDDESFFNIFSVPLKMKGYDVVHVAEGSRAMDFILQEGMSGLDVLKEMKENMDTKEIKVVMLTNFGNDENVKKAVEYGAEDYYMKYNVVPSELPEKIAVLLGETPDTGIVVTG